MASAKDIRIAPSQAPGAGVAEALKHAVYMAQSETVTCSSDSSPQYLFNINHNVFVSDLVLEVSSAYNGTYILAGIAGDCDCFISDTTAAVVMVGGTTYSMKSGGNAGIYKGGYNSTSDQVVELRYDGSLGTIKANIFISAYADEVNLV